MIEIEQMSSAYRIAGRSESRADISRRLDRVVREEVPTTLELVASELTTEDGPLYIIRRLDIALWLNTSTLHDPAIARSWAEALAGAIYRQITDGDSDEVMRYESHVDFLVAWISDLLDGRAADRWCYRSLVLYNDLPAGQASAVVLSQHPADLFAVLHELVGRNRFDQLVESLTEADVELLWTAAVGHAPLAPDHVTPESVHRIGKARVRVAGLDDVQTSAGRARLSMRWLLALLAPAMSTVPAAVAGLAMQAAHVQAMVAAQPELQRFLSDPLVPVNEIHALIGPLTSRLARPAEWLTTVVDHPPARAALVDLVAGISGPEPYVNAQSQAEPERRPTSFAGLALLLGALSTTGLSEQLNPAEMHRLLVSAVGGPEQLLAEADPVLRWYCGLLEESTFERATNFPGAEQFGVVVSPDDREFCGGPEIAALRVACDEFARGLRGVEGSSLAYLSRQFWQRPGTISRTDNMLHVHMPSVPLKILLQMGGRLGGQSRRAWLGERALVIEVGDG